MKKNYFKKMQYAAYKRQRRRAFWQAVKNNAPDALFMLFMFAGFVFVLFMLAYVFPDYF
jgi:hypothetical protein